MLAGTRAITKDAGTLHHDVDIKFTPWELLRIPLRAGRDQLAVDLQTPLDSLNLTGEPTMHRIVGEQVGKDVVVRQVIDVNKLNIGIIQRGTKYVATDASKTVETISEVAKTGKIGDGKIFVTPVESALRIRTDEKNDDAI